MQDEEEEEEEERKAESGIEIHAARTRLAVDRNARSSTDITLTPSLRQTSIDYPLTFIKHLSTTLPSNLHQTFVDYPQHFIKPFLSCPSSAAWYDLSLLLIPEDSMHLQPRELFLNP